MRRPHQLCVCHVLLLTVLLASCGGSGPMTADSGGIGGSGIISQGEIAGFGSILVNGTEFDTRNAVIVVQGEEKGVGDRVALQNLNIGKVVTVQGSAGDGPVNAVASRVTYTQNVRGPVEQVRDRGKGSRELMVLGQIVKVDGRTKFEGTLFDALTRNDVIEVSGFVDQTGALRATFVEKVGAFLPGVRVTVVGVVKNLNTALKIFNINDLTVDYGAAETGALSGGVPQNGLEIAAEGVLDAAGGRMSATELEPKAALSEDDADEVELAGIVTAFKSAFEFTVASQPVETDAETLFVGGRPEDVRPGVRLEVEGELFGSVLVAAEVEFWHPNRIELEGVVTQFKSVFEFNVGDQSVRTDEDTVYENGEPEDLVQGVEIEAEGVIVDGILYADKISFGDE